MMSFPKKCYANVLHNKNLTQNKLFDNIKVVFYIVLTIY